MKDSNIIKCFSKGHSDILAICYCIECKIYICDKCNNMHSILFQNHHLYKLDKNINEIFTGFCSEENHTDKLEYFCKTHNKLWCSACIAKVKRKDKGQHSDCDISLIEDIKEIKQKQLNENILSLEDLSKNIEKSINGLKEMFEKINKDKEELKLNIQKIFTKIRNEINEREDKILIDVDNLYDKTFIKEDIINKMDKLPKEIITSLQKGKNINKEWNDENKLSLLIENCINIENKIWILIQFKKV